ncbi:hypothetical protein [Rhodospira trueperi]|uniref:Uncharacterized protein n=1 Tax=Rhodospira trueperi TaxID=69960 RepID=A0A1G7GHL3_9PROT|nr:hypothetical protein [Rhodospira trueperi]SDE87573.1 hypothetical protein SAMN05421720_114102 [Rhodospira trueperi]
MSGVVERRTLASKDRAASGRDDQHQTRSILAPGAPLSTDCPVSETGDIMDGAESEGLILHVETTPKVNFACHQSAFPVVRALSVENRGPDTAKNTLLKTAAQNPR